MQPLSQLQAGLARSRRVPALVVTLTLLVLAATVALTIRQVRAAIRDQIVHRDGTVLHAVALTQLDEVTRVAEPGDAPDLLAVVLVTSRLLNGVLAARLLDDHGRFVEALPLTVREADISLRDLEALRRLEPVSRLHAAVEPLVVFYPEAGQPPRDEAPMPMLEVNVPLHMPGSSRLLGIGQFLLEGHSVKREFERLDRHLLYQACGTFVVAGSILAGAMAWAFRRLRRTHRELTARTSDLLRANQELALVAKTSAVGAVASHLIHGLKNPLAGLQQFMADAARSGAAEGGTNWEHAAASARRMQTMIHDVVNVLREQEVCSQYELTLAELVDLVEERARSVAMRRSVTFQSRTAGTRSFDNRTANLLAFVLLNLIENAVEASAAGQPVELESEVTNSAVTFRVVDRGPGFPESHRSDPFAPRPSSKEEGAGIGLAISRQLAQHLGASLELRSSSPSGCVFEVTLPTT